MATDLFKEWYDSQGGFYWNWLKSNIRAKDGWFETYKKEALDSRKKIKDLQESIENKNLEIKNLNSEAKKLKDLLYYSRNKIYDV